MQSMVEINSLRGLGNYFQSEAEPNSLPLEQNSPQKVPYNLYAEQINGSAFTCNRENNYFIWAYRLQPSVVHSAYTIYKEAQLFELESPPSPNQLRYSSLYNNTNNLETSFSEGIQAIAANDVSRTYAYNVNQDNSKQFFVNLDGEFLIVAQKGNLTLETEFGQLLISPGEIAVIPRGITFQALGKNCYGYICESLAGRFRLPNLGPIGANGLANPHDFIHPHAKYFNETGDFQTISLYQNHLWQSSTEQHPLNIVAWKGNYLPYKYNLKLFNVLNTVSFDHPDPSIFTVLTVPSVSAGTANIDFVIFPERWTVAEHTFRPPYYHKNIMSEFMGLIYGEYDAKKADFVPGGFSIHNCMTPHGPDKDTYNDATSATLENKRYENTLAFMFESNQSWQLDHSLVNSKFKQDNYNNCWQGLKNNFKR